MDCERCRWYQVQISIPLIVKLLNVDRFLAVSSLGDKREAEGNLVTSLANRRRRVAPLEGRCWLVCSIVRLPTGLLACLAVFVSLSQGERCLIAIRRASWAMETYRGELEPERSESESRFLAALEMQPRVGCEGQQVDWTSEWRIESTILWSWRRMGKPWQ